MADHDLIKVLREAQRIGIIGPTDVEVELAHARQYVPGIPPDARDVVDLGSGAGLPGLVIAHDCPALRVLLVERRAKRTDFLRRAVGALNLRGRVQVTGDDVERLLGRPGQVCGYDVVSARAFGPPESTLHFASRLLRPDGLVLVSLPPEGDLGPLTQAAARYDGEIVALPGGQVASVRLPQGPHT